MIQFHSLACSCPVLPTPAVEEAVISPLYIHGFFIVCELPIYASVYIWALYSVPLVFGSGLVPVPNCLDYGDFVVGLEVRECNSPPALFFLLRITLAIPGLLWFHVNFRMTCSSLFKNAVAILIGIALNL